MKQEEKVINAALEYCEVPEAKAQEIEPILQTTPVLSPAELNKDFSYRELKKGAQDILMLSAFNLNTLFKTQNINFPIIRSVCFSHFNLCGNKLAGNFKVVLNDNNESFVSVYWNGNSLSV